MKAKMMVAAVIALFMSAGAYAQSQTDVYKVKPKLTPEQREARKAERKAFKQAHREQMQARLNAMTPEQRAKVMERRKHHKEMKEQGSK